MVAITGDPPSTTRTYLFDVMKTCFKCGLSKPIDDFYRHPEMADGHLGKCKECAKADAHGRLLVNGDAVRAYDRARSKTPARKAASAITVKKSRKRNPQKWAARRAVSNAIRDGRLARQGCEICGVRAEAHHEDYDKPLDVRWLCFRHHREEHGRIAA